MRNSTKLSSGISPLNQCCSGAGIRRVVGQRHSLAYNPVLHPVRDGRESSPVTVSTEVVDHAIAGAVCLENGHILAGKALRLTRCISVHRIRISALKSSGVESTRIGGDGCEYATEIGITCEDTAEAASIAVACCKDTGRVDAEHVLYDCDKFFDIFQVSLLRIASGSGSDTVIRVRLPDRKSTRLNSSHSGESRMPSSA